MTVLSPDEDQSSEEEDFIDNLNEIRKAIYLIDSSYKRPPKPYPLSLNKIDEVDETSIKSSETSRSREHDENGNIVQENEEIVDNLIDDGNEEVVAIKPQTVQFSTGTTSQRPRSASYLDERNRKNIENNEAPQKSTCNNYRSKIPVKEGNCKAPHKPASDSESSSYLSITSEHKRPRSAGGQRSTPKNYETDWTSFYKDYDRVDSFWIDDYPVRPKSACNMRHPHEVRKIRRERRTNSQPNVSQRLKKPSTQSWCELSRFKRCLQLLGLSNSDLGLPDSPKQTNIPPRPKSSYQVAPTFQTKVLRRTVSLECLREVIREAALNNCSGFPERHILATAAYEEWYFKKKEEAKIKQNDEREKIEKLRSDIETKNLLKREKAKEEFKRWMSKKKNQCRKENDSIANQSGAFIGRSIKSREEIEKAYDKWKQQKQVDLENRRKKLKEKAEKEEREKAEKEEKRIQAEKVFKEWKKKQDEILRSKREKEKTAKEKLIQQVVVAKRNQNTTFQAWKHIKDDEIKAKLRRIREAAHAAEVRRSIHVTERMYEAEQAFEDWLDKVDRRNNERIIETKGNIPWAPA